jgi:AsmA protein
VKRFLAFLLTLVILLVAAALIVPLFIPLEVYRDRITAAVKVQTGRELVIGGDISFSILPYFGLTMENVTFSNPLGAKEPFMASMKELGASVALRPLLQGVLEINSFVLREPEIHLEIGRDGRANWQFEGGPEAVSDSAQKETGGTITLREVRLNNVRIEDGRATYTDRRTNQHFAAENVDIALALPSLDEPFEADGALNWNAERVKIVLVVDEPRTLLDQGNSGVSLKMSAAPLQLDYKGKIASLSPLQASGAAELDVPSLQKLLVWVGSPPAEKLAPEHLALAGALNIKGDNYSFEKASLTLDQMKGQGRLSANLAGSVPRINGNLHVDTLNLNALSGEETTAGQADTAPATATQWSTEPIDFSGLNSINGSFDLSADKILTGDLTIGRSALAMVFEGGVMTTTLKEMALYDGKGSGNIRIDGRKPASQVAARFAFSGLQILPFFSDAAGFDRVRGTGNLLLDIATGGRNQKEMMQNLSGSGNMTIANGAIVGVDIAGMIRDALSFIVQGWTKGERRDTDFSELSGSFTIAQGVLNNKDLNLIGPLVRMGGHGDINIAEQSLNYVVEPKFVATLKGQGDAGQRKGVLVPIKVTGSWHDPKFSPDLAGILSDPAAALESVNQIKQSIQEKGVGGLVGGLLGKPAGEQQKSAEPLQGEQGQQAPPEQKPATPQDVLKNLLGGRQ